MISLNVLIVVLVVWIAWVVALALWDQAELEGLEVLEYLVLGLKFLQGQK